MNIRERETPRQKKTRPEKSWEQKLCMQGKRERAERQNGEMFLPTSLLQPQRVKEDKHTRRAMVQVNNLTKACTPGRKG